MANYKLVEAAKLVEAGQRRPWGEINEWKWVDQKTLDSLRRGRARAAAWRRLQNDLRLEPIPDEFLP